jgi:hypothetical protein
MIGQIGYLGQVSRRIGLVSATLYAFGAASGALVLGFAFGVAGIVIGWLLNASFEPFEPYETVPRLIVGGLALLGGLWDLGAIPLRLPEPTKQLPRHWLAVLGPYRTSFLWGLHVGIGRKTRTGSALLYVLTVWILLVGDAAYGARVLSIYGLSHGLLLIAEVAGIATGRMDPLQGLLGLRRSEFFFRYSGLALLACGIFLLAPSVQRKHTYENGNHDAPIHNVARAPGARHDVDYSRLG